MTPSHAHSGLSIFEIAFEFAYREVASIKTCLILKPFQKLRRAKKFEVPDKKGLLFCQVPKNFFNPSYFERL